MTTLLTAPSQTLAGALIVIAVIAFVVLVGTTKNGGAGAPDDPAQED